jgi:hypothetical protein
MYGLFNTRAFTLPAAAAAEERAGRAAAGKAVARATVSRD